MRGAWKIPYNVPCYRDIKVGDKLILFSMASILKPDDPFHCHVCEVEGKLDRYAKLYLSVDTCINDADVIVDACTGKKLEMNYSELTRNSELVRLLTPAIEVLFGEKKCLHRAIRDLTGK